jgi:cysteine synthase B
VLRGELPLHDHVRAAQRDAWIAEQAGEDRAGACERQVRDDAELLARPRLPLGVAFHDDGAIREARAIHAREPRLFYPDQYNNDANWRAHYDTTAIEILEQTEGRVTHFVAGLGTSGTFMGIGRRLREHSSGIRLISVQPDSGMHGIEGLKHMDSAIRPGIYDPALADEDVRIATERAYSLTRRLAAEEGLLVGVSSGAALAVALDVAAQIREGVIVTIFPDSGARYLTEHFWDSEDGR